MSQHQFFRRTAVPAQVATKQETITFPAPTRGLIQSENESYMQPGSALVMDNWAPTMKGAKIRGGCDLWCDLYEGVSGDPHFANVKLLLGFEGADAATGAPGMTDESPAVHGTGTVVGNAQIDTAQFKFGTASLLGDGTGDGVSFPDSDDWKLSNANSDQFTIEAWVRPNTTTPTDKVIVCQSTGAFGLGFFFYCNATGNGELTFHGTTTTSTLDWTPASSSGITWTAGTWYHVAADKDATGKVRVYRNGVMVGASTPVSSIMANPTTALTIGIDGLGGRSWNGWIDEVRITKGTARYASDAGYTVPTTAFPRVATIPTPPLTDPSRKPLISAFEYMSGIVHKMFFADETKVYDVSTSTATVAASGRTSGNYAASQMANAAGDYLMVVNDAGDFPLRFDGTTWTTLSAGQITGPVGSIVVAGAGLTYVCKYRNRYFFIERNSMNAWYLPLNAIQGALSMIPLSGAATKGGKLLFCTSWSIDAGDGIDDKIVFVTDQGEAIIFTGSDPASAANWRQEGRYMLSPPMGMNAHLSIGGDLLIACVDGILPMSGAITKDRAELELAAVTRAIKPMWRAEVLDKRDQHWTMKKWDEYGGVFTTFPGGLPGNYVCLATNAATGAHARYTGWDAMCFARMRGDCFFGTQTGQVMQMDRTGYDNGVPYLCTLVGGWEVFQSPSQTITWKQARASFSARGGEPFVPQLGGTTDYVVSLPTPPSAAPDPGVLDLWDQGVWDDAVWDAGTPATPVVRNTGWVSIGVTGFSHAPIVQVQMAQQAKPEVELISIAGVFERLAITI